MTTSIFGNFYCRGGIIIEWNIIYSEHNLFIIYIILVISPIVIMPSILAISPIEVISYILEISPLVTISTIIAIFPILLISIQSCIVWINI